MKNKNEKPLDWVFAGAIAGVIGFISGRSLWLQADLNLLMSIVCGVLVTLLACLMFYKPLEVFKAVAESFCAARNTIRESRARAQKLKEEKLAYQKQWSVKRLEFYKKMLNKVHFLYSLCCGINSFLWIIFSASIIASLVCIMYLSPSIEYAGDIKHDLFSFAVGSLIGSSLLGTTACIFSYYVCTGHSTLVVPKLFYYHYYEPQRFKSISARRFKKEFNSVEYNLNGWTERNLYQYIMRQVDTFEIDGVKHIRVKFSEICKLACRYMLRNFFYFTPIYYILAGTYSVLQLLLFILKAIPRCLTLTSLWIKTFTLSLIIQLNTQARIAIISCAGVGYIGGWMAELVGYQQAALISFGVGLVFGFVQHFVYGLFSNKIKALHRVLLIRRIRIA